MRTQFMSWVMILFLAPHPPALANDSRILTLDAAIHIALEQNNLLRQANNNRALSELDVQQTWMRFVPAFNISANGTQTRIRHGQDSKLAGMGVTSDLVLFDGLRDVTALRMAKLQSQAA